MAKEPTLTQKAAVEALGAFFLVFLGGGVLLTTTFFFAPASSQLLMIAIGYGIALAIGVTMAMNISGGHLNPAVTIAMLVAKKIKTMDAAVYIVAQVIGAMIGAALLFVFPIQAGIASAWSVPSLSPIVSVSQGIAIEAIITFILVTAVFWTAVDKNSPKVAGFGIGLALMLDILLAGPYTGAAANPARALGPMIASLNFTNWYVYWIGPILGGIVAALLYLYISSRK